MWEYHEIARPCYPVTLLLSILLVLFFYFSFFASDSWCVTYDFPTCQSYKGHIGTHFETKKRNFVCSHGHKQKAMVYMPYGMNFGTTIIIPRTNIVLNWNALVIDRIFRFLIFFLVLLHIISFQTQVMEMLRERFFKIRGRGEGATIFIYLSCTLHSQISMKVSLY